MDEIQKARREVTARLGERGHLFGLFTLIAKVFAAVGGCVVAVASLFADHMWGKAVGTSAGTIVFLSSVVLLLIERDGSIVLAHASAALDATLEEREKHRLSEDEHVEREKIYRGELARQSYFFAAMSTIQLYLSTLAGAPKRAPAESFQIMLTNAKRSLFLAMGFDMTDFYTICVHQAYWDPDQNKILLKCVAAIRAIDCPNSAARIWPEGKAAAGLAFADHRTVVLDDLSNPAYAAIMENTVKLPHDATRHRSVAAFPLYDGGIRPWGVLSASSSIANHFSWKEHDYVDVGQALADSFSTALRIANLQ